MGQRRNWSQYNRKLVNRGKICFWVGPQVFKNWRAKGKKKSGHPFVYSDELVQAISFIRFKFRMSLRGVEGLFRSLVEMMGRRVGIPVYSQICRRMKTLVMPGELFDKREVTDIVLDTTGLKVYGEGEWRASKYGGKKGWKKLHLAMDPRSGKLVLAEVSEETIHDTAYLEKALKSTNRRRGKVLIDGIADTQRCYRLCARYNKKLLTPPRRGAVFRSDFPDRNDAIQIIGRLGYDRTARSIWGKLTGYNRRVVIESMISRWKRLFSGELSSRCQVRRKIEVTLKAIMINEMIEAEAA